MSIFNIHNLLYYILASLHDVSQKKNVFRKVILHEPELKGLGEDILCIAPCFQGTTTSAVEEPANQ